MTFKDRAIKAGFTILNEEGKQLMNRSLDGANGDSKMIIGYFVAGGSPCENMINYLNDSRILHERKDIAKWAVVLEGGWDPLVDFVETQNLDKLCVPKIEFRKTTSGLSAPDRCYINRAYYGISEDIERKLESFFN